MLAWVAFTNDDLPMPRAPQSSALLAGKPLAKRSVFSIRMSRIRSMPLSRLISTRLTRGTGASRPSGCQINASAWPSESAVEEALDAADRCAAMASSANAIRSAAPRSAAAGDRLVAAGGVFRCTALAPARAAALVGFFDIFGLPDAAPLTGLTGGRKRGQIEGSGGVAIGTTAAIFRANLPGSARRPSALPPLPASRGLHEC